jgi:hypothetical protein
MVTANGGNIGLFSGSDGTFLIDDPFASRVCGVDPRSFRQIERPGGRKAAGYTHS